jgi:hypothetical protein
MQATDLFDQLDFKFVILWDSSYFGLLVASITIYISAWCMVDSTCTSCNTILSTVKGWCSSEIYVALFPLCWKVSLMFLLS